MFLVKCRPVGTLNSKSIRCFSLSTPDNRSRNHYDALGLTPKATQADIKTAYYNLSMQYHPDKNKGSENAAEVFRDITAAYEVLGNLKLRKLYDKGILHTAGAQYAQQGDHEDMQMQDDSQKKFYRSREQRTRAPPPSGRSPIYNFDEWTQAHYGSSFARREAAKVRYERKVSVNVSDKQTLGTELLFFVAVGILTIFGFAYVKTVTYDEPNESVDTKEIESPLPQ